MMKKTLFAAAAVLGLAAMPVMAQTTYPSTNGTTTTPVPAAPAAPGVTVVPKEPSTMPDQVGGGTATNPSQAQVPRTPSDLDRQDHRGSTLRPGTQGGGPIGVAPGQPTTR